jgi:hypothetical protein
MSELWLIVVKVAQVCWLAMSFYFLWKCRRLERDIMNRDCPGCVAWRTKAALWEITARVRTMEDKVLGKYGLQRKAEEATKEAK